MLVRDVRDRVESIANGWLPALGAYSGRRREERTGDVGASDDELVLIVLLLRGAAEVEEVGSAGRFTGDVVGGRIVLHPESDGSSGRLRGEGRIVASRASWEGDEEASHEDPASAGIDELAAGASLRDDGAHRSLSAARSVAAAPWNAGGALEEDTLGRNDGADVEVESAYGAENDLWRGTGIRLRGKFATGRIWGDVSTVGSTSVGMSGAENDLKISGRVGEGIGVARSSSFISRPGGWLGELSESYTVTKSPGRGVRLEAQLRSFMVVSLGPCSCNGTTT